MSVDQADDGSSSTPPRIPSGALIAGKYRVRALLGRGGVGEVYRAHHETLDVDVALKVLRAEVEGPEAVERFLREARLAARLEHPAIARTIDFGRAEDGAPFIVMELLDGEDLGTAISRDGAAGAVLAVRTLLPIASALSFAHGKGIVHRDLKPENVFVARGTRGRRQPKIVDFGIARLRDEAHALHSTRADELLGSPAYIAPEQARGGEADHRGDVWSFSVVLYELVTGRRPFSGASYNAVIHSIQTSEPPSILELGVPDDALWQILRRGLSKDPDLRFQSMRELGEALALWLSSRGVKDDVSGASVEAAFRGPSSGFPEAPEEGRLELPSHSHVATLPPRLERATQSRRVAVALSVFGLLAGGAALLLFWAPRDTSPAKVASAMPSSAAVPDPPPAAPVDPTPRVAGNRAQPLPADSAASVHAVPPAPSAGARPSAPRTASRPHARSLATEKVPAVAAPQDLKNPFR